MALEFAHGAIRWLAADAVSTTYPVTGLAFEPKALRFYWVGLDSAGTDVASEAVDSRRGVGFATGTSSRRSVGSFSQDTAGTSNCGTVASDDCVACTTDGAGARDGLLDISAIASDGFTLIVDDQGVADITIFWEAWGGSDITVAEVGDIAEPAATGNQDYIVTGFVSGATDQVVMLAGVQSVAAVNTAEAEASGMFVGFAASATAADNICVSGNSDDASPSMDTDGHCISDECLGMIAKAGAATVGARAVLTQFGTDNFRLNWAARAVTNRRSIFLAIKGGRWQSGSLTIAGNTLNNTSAVSNTIFTPIGICLIGRMTAEQATNVSTANDRIGIGTGTSTTSRRSMGMLDEDATASSTCEINTTIQYDQVLCYPDTAGALLTAYDISSMDTGGFTLINDLAGGVASEWIGYLAFGNPVAKTASDSVAVQLTESATVEEPLLAEYTASDSLATQLTESASILSIIPVADSLSVKTTETDIAAFEYNLIESLPINLTEVATLDTGTTLAEKTGSESLLVGLTEDAILYVRQDASDSLSVGLTENAVVAVTLASSDDLVSGLTESAAQLVAQNVSESLALGLTESAAQTVSQFVNENLPIGLTDTATQQISAIAEDSLPISFTDSAAASVTLTTSDDLAVSLTESASPIASIVGSDSLFVVISEADIARFEYNLIDSLTIGLTESASLDTGSGLIEKSASESLQIGLTESTTIAVSNVASDSLRVIIEEPDTYSQQVFPVAESLTVAITETTTSLLLSSASDSLTIQLTESLAAAAAILTADTLAVDLTETATASAQIAASDDVSVVIAESSTGYSLGTTSDDVHVDLTEQATVDTGVTITPIAANESLALGLIESALITAVNATATDSLPLQLTESTLTVSIGSASDALAIQLTEQATVEDLTTGLAVKASSDTLTIGLDEQTSGYVTGSGSDTGFSGLEESATVIVFVATDDSITVRAQDDVQSISVSLSVADTLPAGYAEAVLQHIYAVASESLATVLDESVFIFNQFAAQDSLAVVVTDVGQVFDVSDLLEKAGADNVSVSLTESSILFTRTVGTLSPLVATVEYIGVQRREVGSIGVPNDVKVVASV